MTSHALVELVRSATGIVVAPIMVGVAGLAVGASVVVTLGALAVSVMVAARRLGREQGAYAALVASAMLAGVYATTHHHTSGSAGGPELLAFAFLLGVALVAARPQKVRSEIPHAGGVAAHDELALVGRDAGELLVDQRS